MNFQRNADFRRTMEERPVFGVFSKTRDPALIECLGYGGFDFVILDLEHGPNTIQTTQELIRAAEVSGLFPIVRVKEEVPSAVGEALDIGAGGIEAPQIRCREDAEALVALAKFAPAGMRGACRYVRAAGYTRLPKEEYFRQANSNVLIAQLEGAEALENLEAILEVEGIDVLFLGPYDLAQSMGLPGQVDHPAVVEKMRGVAELCRRRGRLAGTFVDDLAQSERWLRAGVRYIAYSVDMGLFYNHCAATVKALHAL